MLNIESVCSDLTLWLRQKFPAQLQTVVARVGTHIPLSPPKHTSYYLGEWNRFTPYELPAVFIIPTRSTLNYLGRDAGANIDKWQHQILLDYLVEERTEGSLTSACFRMAEAAYACLHDQDITATGVTSRATKVFVAQVDYGPMIANRAAPEQRFFRKDVFFTLNVLHYDQSPPVG